MTRTFSPLAVFALFAFGIEAVVGYVLGQSSGLSELHKTVLVVFLTAFPILALLAFLPLSARDPRPEGEPDLEAISRGYPFRRTEDALAE